MSNQKNIQIPVKLFCEVYTLILNLKDGELDQELLKSIEGQFINKLDAITKRDLYTQSKTAETEAERVAARQEYINRAAMIKESAY